MERGKFISVEGIEGAGKSTALLFIKEYLEKEKIKVHWTREPGGSTLSEEIRRIVLHPMNFADMVPETELLLMFAGRAQHIQQIILPELHAGKWVASDRYIDATYAYQGGGRRIDIKYIKMLDQWIVGPLYPDLTILLDIPPEIGLKRAEKRGTNKDRIEHENLDFFNRVRETYLDRAHQDPKRIKIIDATQLLIIVQKQIGTLLDEMIR